MKRLCVIAMMLAACSGDDGGGGGGGAWAELSSSEKMDACEMISTSIGTSTGTEYECTSGPNAGVSITVPSTTECAARAYKAGCPITVEQTLECFTAAKANACSSLDGVCGKLLADAIQKCL